MSVDICAVCLFRCEQCCWIFVRGLLCFLDGLICYWFASFLLFDSWLRVRDVLLFWVWWWDCLRIGSTNQHFVIALFKYCFCDCLVLHSTVFGIIKCVVYFLILFALCCFNRRHFHNVLLIEPWIRNRCLSFCREILYFTIRVYIYMLKFICMMIYYMCKYTNTYVST